MKKILRSAIVGLIFAYSLSAPLVFAHVTAKDQGIEVTLHIDPGDNPIVGQIAKLHFNIVQGKDSVDASNCGCMITVEKQGTLLFGKDINNFEFDYVFPEKALYTVILHGKTNFNESFMLTYELRIDREEGKSVKDSLGGTLHFLLHHARHLVIVIGAIIIGIILTIRDTRNNKK